METQSIQDGCVYVSWQTEDTRLFVFNMWTLTSLWTHSVLLVAVSSVPCRKLFILQGKKQIEKLLRGGLLQCASTRWIWRLVQFMKHGTISQSVIGVWSLRLWFYIYYRCNRSLCNTKWLIYFTVMINEIKAMHLASFAVFSPPSLSLHCNWNQSQIKLVLIQKKSQI